MVCVCVCVQDFQPAIYMTDSDFASITHNSALCDSKGQLGPREFEDEMRRQIAEMIQGKLVLNRVRSPQVPRRFGEYKIQ